MTAEHERDTVGGTFIDDVAALGGIPTVGQAKVCWHRHDAPYSLHYSRSPAISFKA